MISGVAFTIALAALLRLLVVTMAAALIHQNTERSEPQRRVLVRYATSMMLYALVVLVGAFIAGVYSHG